MEIINFVLLIIVLLIQIFVIYKLQKLGKNNTFSVDNRSDDELYEEAKKIVIEAGKASASYLQRRLQIGYARSARLLDMLEEEGIVGPAIGSEPREVKK